MDKYKIRYYLDYLLYPGVVIHELAHAIIISFIPNMNVTDFKASVHNGGFVKYYGPIPTATRQFLISYAPFYINTIISVFCVYYIIHIPPFQSILDIFTVFILFYVSIVSAFTALPSSSDSVSPINNMRNHFFTRRLPLIMTWGVVIFLLCLPYVLLSKIRMTNSRFYYLIGFLYALVVTVITTLATLGYIKPDILHLYYTEFLLDSHLQCCKWDFRSDWYLQYQYN